MRFGTLLDQEIHGLETTGPHCNPGEVDRRLAMAMLQTANVRELVRERQYKRTDREYGQEKRPVSSQSRFHHAE